MALNDSLQALGVELKYSFMLLFRWCQHRFHAPFQSFSCSFGSDPRLLSFVVFLHTYCLNHYTLQGSNHHPAWDEHLMFSHTVVSRFCICYLACPSWSWPMSCSTFFLFRGQICLLLRHPCGLCLCWSLFRPCRRFILWSRCGRCAWRCSSSLPAGHWCYRRFCCRLKCLLRHPLQRRYQMSHSAAPLTRCCFQCVLGYVVEVDTRTWCPRLRDSLVVF